MNLSASTSFVSIPPQTPSSPPTQLEAYALASLVSTTPRHTPPIPDAIRDVFHLCRHPSIAQFLFTPEESSVTTLTAPVNIQHAIACTVTVTNVERVSDNNPFDVHVQGDYVFVPSFSINGITVGFGVLNSYVISHPTWCAKPGSGMFSTLTHFRYVREESTGTLINVHSSAGTGNIQIDYMVHQTTQIRRRAFLVLNNTVIQTILQQSTPMFDYSPLAQAVILIKTATEYRQCPFCQAPPANVCACKHSFQHPKHPLDFDMTDANMSSHLGTFLGTTAAKHCVNGTMVKEATLGSRIFIKCGLDVHLIERLRRWAVADQLKLVKQDPVKCIMPHADEFHVEMEQIPVGADVDVALGIGNMSGEQQQHQQQYQQQLQQQFVNPFGSVHTVGTGSSAIDDVLERYADHKESSKESNIQPLGNRTLFERLSPDVDDVRISDDISFEQGMYMEEEDGIQSSLGSASEERVMNDKERKAELRRERNREAAQRSNMKRKLKNDTLKSQLLDTHQHAAVLRAKELRLREENIRLRKMLASL